MPSPQTLSEADRRAVAAWAADCAEHVLEIFEAAAPGDGRPRELIARARAFARGEFGAAEGIRRRFEGGVPAHEGHTAAAAAAARPAGQAAAVPHMGAHALGAAAYAAKAAGLAAPDEGAAREAEVRWQLDHMCAAVRAALRLLPPVGENAAGPLGPGLLTSGLLRAIIEELQAGLGDTTTRPRPARTTVRPGDRLRDASDHQDGAWRPARRSVAPLRSGSRHDHGEQVRPRRQ